jgi:hypothetical protein
MPPRTQSKVLGEFSPQELAVQSSRRYPDNDFRRQEHLLWWGPRNRRAHSTEQGNCLQSDQETGSGRVASPGRQGVEKRPGKGVHGDHARPMGRIVRERLMQIAARACWKIKKLGRKTVRVFRTVSDKKRTGSPYGNRTGFPYTIFDYSFEVTAPLRAARRGCHAKVLSFESTGASRLKATNAFCLGSPLSWEAESGPPVTSEKGGTEKSMAATRGRARHEKNLCRSCTRRGDGIQEN